MAFDASLAHKAVNRLATRLQLPDATTEVQIRFSADQLAQITLTRLLTAAEIDEIGMWYVVEGIDLHPVGETTYNLEPRPVVAAPEEPINCNPLEQQARQDRLDDLYQEDGRDDSAHPLHATYTGLVAPADGDG